MTKFLTYYNLCPIPEPKQFLGISPDKEEGNIINTLDKNIVIIIKISTQKQIRCWSVLEKLSCKVVYDRKSEKYVGVFGKKSIRCWDEDTADVNKCKKLKFHKSIADLVYDKKEVTILYSDGSSAPLSVGIESRKNDEGTQNSQMELLSDLIFSNASVHYLSNGTSILTYFERNINTGDYHLVRTPLHGEGDQLKRFSLKRGILDVHVSGAAVFEGDGMPVLLTVWSDKRIFLLNLADDTEPERSPGNFVSMLTQLKVDTPLSILGISKHFVAIYGANHGQEGASVLLYNTQYKVIKTKQYFKVYFNFSQLWSFEEHILLAMGQNLSVVKYRVLKEVLSDLVGTQIGHDYHSTIEDPHINEEDYLEECLQYTDEITKIRMSASQAKQNNDQEAKEADGNFVPFLDTKDFDKELNLLKQMNLHIDSVEEDQQLDDIQISLMTNYNDSGFTSPAIELIAKQLEKTGASEHEITEKLLTLLIKADMTKNIAACLRRYNNVSEKILSKTLSYLLTRLASGDGEKDDTVPVLTNGIKKEPMEVDITLKNEKDAKPYPNLDLLKAKPPSGGNTYKIKDILNILLSCSFDAEAIIVHIRRDIEYSQILLILEHLYNMLATPQPSFLDERPSLDHCSTDYEVQLLRWFGVFLNSHFQKLALSKDEDLVELLLKWHKLFQSYKREITQLETVAALLYNLVERKNKLKTNYSSRWYSIEEVQLF